ncbi:MAG: EthD family reductase [Xanthobacteraceae bacterium]
MTIVCEVAFAAAHTEAAAAPHQVSPHLARHWSELPDLLTLDIYTPAADPVHDPYIDDGPAPLHLAMLAFASLDALDRAAHHPAFAAGLSAIETVVSCTAMRRSDHPTAGETTAAMLAAPFSYVVRYHRPAADEALFVRHYIETHPPLLGHLPAIRNVMCYLPLLWRGPTAHPSADYLIGNEVVFDHRDAFNAAMKSPVRHELRAHYHTFPAHSGRNTHFAMHRARLFG